MVSILEEFYRGNIKPVERDYQKNAYSKQFRKLMKTQSEVGDQLIKMFNQEQLALFQNYCDLQAKMDIVLQEDF